VRAPVEKEPCRLQRICVAHHSHHLAGMRERQVLHHGEDAAAKGVDSLIAGEQPSLCLVHQPKGSAHGDLPERHALEVAAELGFSQLGVRLEDCRRGEPAVDQLSGFDRAGERAVHDSLQIGGAKPIPNCQRLRAANGAELETVEVTVQQPARILDVGVPDQKDASLSQIDSDATEGRGAAEGPAERFGVQVVQMLGDAEQRTGAHPKDA